MFIFHRAHQDSQATVSPPREVGGTEAVAWATTESKNAPGAATPDALDRNATPVKGASRGSAYTTPPSAQAPRPERVPADAGAPAGEPAPAGRVGEARQDLADRRGGSRHSAARRQEVGRRGASPARADAHLIGSVAAFHWLMSGAR